jgi:DNA-binding protein YbaB
MAFGYEKEVEREHQRLMAAIKADNGEKLEQLQAENERLKEAIRRIADQDATVSMCNGNVTVDMDGTLTPEEREVLAQCVKDYEDSAALCYEQVRHTEAAKRMKQAVVIRGLLERLGGGNDC